MSRAPRWSLSLFLVDDFILVLFPGVWYNLLQERTLEMRARDGAVTPHPGQNFVDEVAVLLWGCCFQLVTMVACFWFDLIPDFGGSTSISGFFSGTWSAIECQFLGEQCPAKVLYLGVIFNVGYAISYLGGVALNRESTNYAQIGGTISTPLAASFWFIFPHLAVVPNPPLWSILPGIGLALIGTVLWKLWERGVLASAPDGYEPINS